MSPLEPLPAVSRKIQMPSARFGIGEVVRHRIFDFRGVIFDVDPVFANSDEWYESIPEAIRPSKDQPFYHLLAENAETNYVAYVSQQNLVTDDIFLGRKWITDLELRFSPGGRDTVEFALGANNLFDVYPDRSPFGARPASVGGFYPANQIYIPYSIFSPFGFNGRYLYGRASVNF
jgi:heat shock protein HspQ